MLLVSDMEGLVIVVGNEQKQLNAIQREDGRRGGKGMGCYLERSVVPK